MIFETCCMGASSHHEHQRRPSQSYRTEQTSSSRYSLQLHPAKLACELLFLLFELCRQRKEFSSLMLSDQQLLQLVLLFFCKKHEILLQRSCFSGYLVRHGVPAMCQSATFSFHIETGLTSHCRRNCRRRHDNLCR